jgi:hypothetical protein
VGTLTFSKEGYPLELNRASDGMLRLWMKPRVEGDIRYHLRGDQSVFPIFRGGAAVDIGAGTGNTPQCLSLMNASTGEKVAEYSNALIFAHDFAAFTVAFLRMFRDESGMHPILAWEAHGSAVFARCVQDFLHYFPYYMPRDEDKVAKPYLTSKKAGLVCTPNNILTMMEDYKHALYEEKCINRSEWALSEAMNIIYTLTHCEYKSPGKKADHASGAKVHHADIVRADALCYKMIKDMGFESMVDEKEKAERIDPRTFDGRVRLFELSRQAEESEIWV